ncbi:probable protein phosphatase 2C 65 isoform X2 [Andrographis paniculata]|uniref:probable protein phosphatase 2C 65 isoform X2 n=1 Tax=Andrographis paniculata TaxID=175694 RepID=UPI0021E81039|nr:probable protein phosphatase 2C 65 isoform X2 [Andrographis paniculata]
MGGCCSCRTATSSFVDYHHAHGKEDGEGDAADHDIDIVLKERAGARVLLQGSSKHVSMFTKQGKKSVNQDAMTVWENFLGDKDMFFGAVFDGHGSSGHKVARYIRDFLPAKLYLLLNKSTYGDGKDADVLDMDMETTPDDDDDDDNDADHNPLFLSWKARLTRCFKEMDQQLEREKSIESYCSGSTTVCLLKKHEHLVIANLGDSRAVLCTRDENDRLVSKQLTVDLKPSVSSEAERIKSCSGRVLAVYEEPNVFRVWMPHEDCPGLAMTRAFGDFCLKDFGVISTPQVTYRKLTDKDEFIVLATDGTDMGCSIQQ